MRKEYDINKADAILLSKEQFRLQNKRYKSIGRLIILLAIAYGLFAALTDPPQASPGETLSTQAKIILIACVQLPLITGITFLILKFIHVLPLKLIQWKLERQPDAYFGKRVLTLSDDSIGLEQGPSTLSVKRSHIDEVIEGEAGIHLMHDGKAVFLLPKKVFSPEELRGVQTSA